MRHGHAGAAIEWRLLGRWELSSPRIAASIQQSNVGRQIGGVRAGANMWGLSLSDEWDVGRPFFFKYVPITNSHMGSDVVDKVATT